MLDLSDYLLLHSQLMADPVTLRGLILADWLEEYSYRPEYARLLREYKRPSTEHSGYLGSTCLFTWICGEVPGHYNEKARLPREVFERLASAIQKTSIVATYDTLGLAMLDLYSTLHRLYAPVGVALESNT